MSSQTKENSFKVMKDRCNKNCKTCGFEEHPPDKEPCLSCQHRTSYRDNWKPKEPVVLSVEKWIEQNLDDIGEAEGTNCELIFEGGKKQGRLERDLELRPVIEEVKKILATTCYGYDPNPLSKLRDEFKNLPPIENA